MPKSAYAIDPVATSISRAYYNGKMIADSDLRRLPPVSKEEFKYNEFSNVDEDFTVPDTKIGRTSDANQVGQSSKLLTDSTEDWGLKDVIPQPDIDNAPDGVNLVGRSAEFLTDLILLDREIRVKNLVFDPAQYPASNKLQLDAESKLTSPNCDPIAIFEDSLDSCIMRPNKMAIGRRDFSLLSRNPNILKAVNKSLAGDKGKATRQQILDLFELDEILVGEAWVNTARKGQARNLVRLCDDPLLFFCDNPLADTRQGTTFGYTVPYKQRVAMTKFDDELGLHGSTVIKVGESVKELIVANDMAYLIYGTK